MTSHTEHLFHDDAYQTSFDARIVSRRMVDDYPAVILDATYFYPASGGQPNDLGMLNGVPVRDVTKDGEAIVHILEDGIEGDIAQGEIDWQRRYDHMQQHTGQHILSRVFIDLLDAHTVSFHMNEDICTIDITGKPEGAEAWDAVQNRLYEIIQQDVPVSAYMVQSDEVEMLDIRKVPDREGPLRIVDIEGVDRTACGGTHCSTTGELGVIQILNRNPRRVHGDLYRIEFVSGARALRDYTKKIGLIRNLSDILNTGEQDIRETVSSLVVDKKAADKEINSLREQLLDYEFETLLSAIDTSQSPPVLKRMFRDRSQDELRILSQKITGHASCVVLFGCDTEKPMLTFARSDDLTLHMGDLMREATELIGGRGGGRPNMAMGGGPDGKAVERALDHVLTKIIESG